MTALRTAERAVQPGIQRPPGHRRGDPGRRPAGGAAAQPGPLYAVVHPRDPGWCAPDCRARARTLMGVLSVVPPLAVATACSPEIYGWRNRQGRLMSRSTGVVHTTAWLAKDNRFSLVFGIANWSRNNALLCVLSAGCRAERRLPHLPVPCRSKQRRLCNTICPLCVGCRGHRLHQGYLVHGEIVKPIIKTRSSTLTASGAQSRARLRARSGSPGPPALP